MIIDVMEYRRLYEGSAPVHLRAFALGGYLMVSIRMPRYWAWMKADDWVDGVRRG